MKCDAGKMWCGRLACPHRASDAGKMWCGRLACHHHASDAGKMPAVQRHQEKFQQNGGNFLDASSFTDHNPSSVIEKYEYGRV